MSRMPIVLGLVPLAAGLCLSGKSRQNWSSPRDKNNSLFPK
jgi:hypothetical protein